MSSLAHFLLCFSAGHPIPFRNPFIISVMSKFIRSLRLLLCAAAACTMVACSTTSNVASREIRVSVKDQKLALYEGGQPIRVYAVDL